jgi:hypothetical protein
MTAPFDAMAAVRDALSSLEGVKTAKIGLEANMTPDDYPMVRIVPSRISNGPALTRRMTEALVYFGQPVHEFEDGLEEQWRVLLDMEAAILAALREPIAGVSHIKYLETVLDEDRLEAYKMMALRVEITA